MAQQEEIGKGQSGRDWEDRRSGVRANDKYALQQVVVCALENTRVWQRAEGAHSSLKQPHCAWRVWEGVGGRHERTREPGL